MSATSPLRRKIAHITTVDMTLRYILLHQLQDLRQSGYHVTVISAPGENVFALEEHGFRHIAVTMSRRVTPLADLQALIKLVQIMRREEFDLVHVHTAKASLLGLLAAKLAGVPVTVYTVHGFYFEKDFGRFWRILFLGIEKLQARLASLIFSVNQEDIDTALRLGLCTPAKIKLLGPGGVGIDLNRFSRDTIPSSRLQKLRSELGLIEGTHKIVGFVGRLVAEKGLLELLEAVSLLKPKLPEIRVLIIGPIDSEKPDALMPSIAVDYGLEQECIFVGFRQDIPELMALMDVFVLPSHREGLPVSLMEAAAMQVACITTNVRGCREVVEPNVNGLIIPLHDITALAEAIAQVLCNPEEAQNMGEQGRRLAVSRFDERIPFQNTRLEYERLLQG